jgi:hypothetical protein
MQRQDNSSPQESRNAELRNGEISTRPIIYDPMVQVNQEYDRRDTVSLQVNRSVTIQWLMHFLGGSQCNCEKRLMVSVRGLEETSG